MSNHVCVTTNLDLRVFVHTQREEMQKVVQVNFPIGFRIRRERKVFPSLLRATPCSRRFLVRLPGVRVKFFLLFGESFTDCRIDERTAALLIEWGLLPPLAGLRALSRVNSFRISTVTPARSASWLHIPFLEFLCRRAELAELINCRTRRREGEWLKRFGQHCVKVLPKGNAGGDVWIEMFAGSLRHKRRNVSDQQGSMSRSSGVVTNAVESPVSTVNGVTAAIRSACSLSNSGVGFATMPAKPISLLGI